jgi:hypothetical protein
MPATDEVVDVKNLRKILAEEGLTKTAGRVTREGTSESGRYVLSPFVTFDTDEKQTAVNFLQRELDSFRVNKDGSRSISMYHYTDVDEREAQRIGWLIWTRILAAAKRGSIANGGITMIPLEWLAKKGTKLRGLRPVSRL